MEDLQLGDEIVRKSPKVIEQCKILGIPAEDMHKVYCDGLYTSEQIVARLTLTSLVCWL